MFICTLWVSYVSFGRTKKSCRKDPPGPKADHRSHFRSRLSWKTSQLSAHFPFLEMDPLAACKVRQQGRSDLTGARWKLTETFGQGQFTVAAIYEGVNKFGNEAIVPSLHHRKEGWLRHQENFAKPPKQTQSGWFSFLFFNRKTTPASRKADASRYLFKSLGHPSLR
jgi:hypothetical protein